MAKPKDIVELREQLIDGDANNNLPSNLRLICKNCHALTPTFGNKNRGKGRKHRYRKHC
jgi:hypothetical protein